MSSFMKKLNEQNNKIKDRMSERFKGESVLYMGDPALDWAQGGWERGRANLIYGPSGSGKSGLALHAAAQEQKKTDGIVIIFDSEYSHAGPYNPESKKALERYQKAGLDTDKVIVNQSNEIDVLFGGLADLDKDVRGGLLNVSAIIVDSWGGIESEQAKNKINDGELAAAGNAFGGNAKTMGPVLQHLLRLAAENGITMFFVQHCINNMDQYGPKYVLIGGQKLRFLVHSTLFVETIQSKEASLLAGDEASTKSDDVVVRLGKKIRFRCEKSRQTVEGRKGEFWFDFESLRFARPAESLFNLASNLGIIDHPKTPVLEDKGPNKGTQKVNKDGKPEFKENIAYWEFPVGAATPHKFHGKDATIEALAANANIFAEVQLACKNCTKKDAVGGVKLGEELGFANNEDYSSARALKKK